MTINQAWMKIKDLKLTKTKLVDQPWWQSLSWEMSQVQSFQVHGVKKLLKIQQKLGLTMVENFEIEPGDMMKLVPVDPSCHPGLQEPECILLRVAMT